MRILVHRNGEPLRVGLERAVARGMTHLVVAGDESALPRFLEAVREHPERIWLGGRTSGSFWTWLETGKRLPARATLRAYPVAATRRIRLTGGCATGPHELLVKAVWTGMGARTLPMQVHRTRRRLGAGLACGVQHAWFVFLRLCLPDAGVRIFSDRAFHTLPLGKRLKGAVVELFVREPGSPRRAALSAGLGFFMGLAPIWGFQLAAALLVAHVTRLSKPVAALASQISVPILIPGILYASLVVGRFVLDGRADAELALAPSDFPAWVVGSLVLSTVVAVIGALLVYGLLRGAALLRLEALRDEE